MLYADTYAWLTLVNSELAFKDLDLTFVNIKFGDNCHSSN